LRLPLIFNSAASVLVGSFTEPTPEGVWSPGKGRHYDSLPTCKCETFPTPATALGVPAAQRGWERKLGVRYQETSA